MVNRHIAAAATRRISNAVVHHLLPETESNSTAAGVRDNRESLAVLVLSRKGTPPIRGPLTARPVVHYAHHACVGNLWTTARPDQENALFTTAGNCRAGRRAALWGSRTVPLALTWASNAARWYSLMRPPRTGRPLIRSWERSVSGRGGLGAASVVVGEDGPQVLLAEDQHLAGDPGPGGENEAFCVNVRVRALGAGSSRP